MVKAPGLAENQQKYKTVLNFPSLIENGFKCTNPDYLICLHVLDFH